MHAQCIKGDEMNSNDRANADATSDDLQVQATEMASALRMLKPNAVFRKNQLFSLLYPTIVELLKNNVTQKAILGLLQEKGLKLHPARFKELMAAEADPVAQGCKTPADDTGYKQEGHA